MKNFNITFLPKSDAIPTTGFRIMEDFRQKWHIFLTIGHHPECAIQTELVELHLVLTERKQLVEILSYAKRYEGVIVGWHCTKVKGHGQLKIDTCRAKTLSYDFPKLHHSRTNNCIFGVTAHCPKPGACHICHDRHKVCCKVK